MQSEKHLFDKVKYSIETASLSTSGKFAVCSKNSATSVVDVAEDSVVVVIQLTNQVFRVHLHLRIWLNKLKNNIFTHLHKVFFFYCEELP